MQAPVAVQVLLAQTDILLYLCSFFCYLIFVLFSPAGGALG